MGDAIGGIGKGFSTIGGLGVGIVPGAEVLALAGGLLAGLGDDPEEQAFNPFYAPGYREHRYAGMYDPPVLGGARAAPEGGNSAAGLLWGMPVHPDDEFEEAQIRFGEDPFFGGDQVQKEPPERPDTPSRGLISYRREVAGVSYLKVGIERVLEQGRSRPELEAAGAVPTFWYLDAPSPWNRYRYAVYRKAHPFQGWSGFGPSPGERQAELYRIREQSASKARAYAKKHDLVLKSDDWGLVEGKLDRERWNKWAPKNVVGGKLHAQWLELEAPKLEAIAAETELYWAWRAWEAEQERLREIEAEAAAKVHAAIAELAAGGSVTITADELAAVGLPPVPPPPPMMELEPMLEPVSLPDLASRPSAEPSGQVVLAGAGLLAVLALL